MTRIRKGAYTLWGLLGLTPALAVLTGNLTAAVVCCVVWAAGFWAIRVALSRVDDGSPLMAYVRSPATGAAAVVTLLLAQISAVLGSGLAAMTVVMLAAVALVILVATSSSSHVYGQRLGRIMLTVGSLAVLLFGLEATLWAVEASRPPNDLDVTWGRAVRWNEAGFREREFQTPKPPDTYRVMVLGDSITWGVGLSQDDRYTRLAEQQLRDRIPHRNIEVLNFGLRGIPTVMQRDMLTHLADLVQPDCVVVGFCFNDPQPRRQSYAVEMDRYRPLFAALDGLRSCGLARSADFVHRRTDQLLRNVGLVPQWPEALDRVYRPDSGEWRAFEGALADIRSICAKRNLPPPIFAPLLQGSGDFNEPGELLSRIIAWCSQAEAAARRHGFLTINMQESFKAQGPRDRHVNRWDQHPSAECHEIYASHIAAAIAQVIEQERSDLTAVARGRGRD